MPRLGIGIGLSKFGGIAYDAAAVTLFSRMTTAPSAARKLLISNLIKGLKADGIWSLLDLFYITASHDSQSSLLNWISTSFNCTAVNSPAFVADRGYTSNGTTSYLDTSWIPATHAINYQQNNASLGVYSRTDINGTLRDIGCLNGTLNMHMMARTSGNYNLILNANSSANKTVANSLGFFSGTRVDSSNFKHWQNGVELQNNAVASTGLVTVRSLFICALNSGGSPLNPSTRQIAFAFAGAGSISQLNLFNRIETYMDAIGAGVV